MLPVPGNIAANENNSVQLSDLSASVVKKNQDVRIKSQDKKDTSGIIPAPNFANNQPKDEPQPELKNEAPVIANNIEKPENKNEAPVFANNAARAITNSPSGEFLTLKELAAKAIKEKALDENSVAMQKQNGRLKRFSGWDLAQIVTRGVSKLTGRDLEVKPKYNEEGEVTAYALGNAFEVTRGK